MSIKSTSLVENVDLAKSEKSTVNILNNNTNQLRQSATGGKILFTWEEWEFMETGMARNNETGKEYPVRWRGFAFPIDIVMLIDEHYPLYKK
ncbi:MAG TPA: hypothetical protein PKL77_07285 [Candidatus Omnitrophota bacterium]|nr:hypothetical protein [Candidatus Omnitrophota bacterium]